MCSACGYPPSLGHWTDAGGKTPQERLRIRFRRVDTLKRILKPFGLNARDLGVQSGIQLFDATGRQQACASLEDVWEHVAKFTDGSFDPLKVSHE